MDRLLLLLPTTTYRTEDFVDAATALGVDLICASEAPNTFEALAPDNLLTLDFADPDGAAAAVARFAERRPIRAVVGVDDRTTVTAAAIAARLGLRANSIASASAARDKHLMRERLAAAGVRQPAFRLIPLDVDPVGHGADARLSLRGQAAGALRQPRRDPRRRRRAVRRRRRAHPRHSRRARRGGG